MKKIIGILCIIVLGMFLGMSVKWFKDEQVSLNSVKYLESENCYYEY